MTENERRILLRENVRAGNIKLADAARSAGIITETEYAILQNYGYMGLYGVMTVKEIHQRKGLKESGNFCIEGDNLDLLKLLHQTYLNKIKKIYIDPPYIKLKTLTKALLRFRNSAFVFSLK